MCGLKFRLVRRSGTIGGEDTLTDMNRQGLSFRIFRINPPFPPCESNFVPSISPPHTSQCHRPTWTTECAPMPSLPRPLCNSFFHAVQPLMFSMDRKPKNTPEKVGSTRKGKINGRLLHGATAVVCTSCRFCGKATHGTFKCLSEHIPFSLFYKKKEKSEISRS